jgi:hypothetical protein
MLRGISSVLSGHSIAGSGAPDAAGGWIFQKEQGGTSCGRADVLPRAAQRDGAGEWECGFAHGASLAESGGKGKAGLSGGLRLFFAYVSAEHGFLMGKIHAIWQKSSLMCSSMKTLCCGRSGALVLSGVLLSFATASAWTQTNLVAPGVPLISNQPGQPSVINQPVMVNSFENVEMERLRLAEEVAKMERDDLEFREQVMKLQKKLASASIVGLTPESLPSEYRSFISANAGEIKKSEAYYALLKSVLNDLTPESPYRSRTVEDTTRPATASEKLLKLSEYSEDDDLSRSIRGHIASLSGGRVDDQRRMLEIRRELAMHTTERKRLEWNLKMTYNVNPLTGRQSGTDDERAFLRQQIEEVKGQINTLENEKKSLSHLVTAEVRKLQFQQFIIELAAQQRYIHALIASGFYRNSFKGGDLAISQEAYPTGRSSKPSAPAEPGANSPLPASPAAPAEVPFISTITGLEAFLLNRIRDAIKDREAIENMMREKQVSAAESVLRKMLLTAKYQPELQTIPYSERQRIQQFGQNVRQLSDALNARDYPEMVRLAAEIKKSSSDSGMADLKVFAAEHPRKAMHWARQAEVALKAGERKMGTSLMEAAIRRAPLDSAVAQKIEALQDKAGTNTDLLDDLKKVVAAGDYKSAFDRMNEFAPLAANGTAPDLKASYETLVEREKSLRATLEKGDALERRGAYPDAWMVLNEVHPAAAGDARISERKSRISGKCPRFIGAYTNADEQEKAGKPAIALAWYLSALSDAPSSEELTKKVNTLGKQLLKD